MEKECERAHLKPIFTLQTSLRASLPLASRPEVDPAATCWRKPVVALQINYKKLSRLKPRARNPRTHTAKQIKQIAASIKEFGFISPILVDGDGGIIAGHGRGEGAQPSG